MIDVDAEVRRFVGERPPAQWAWMHDPQYRGQMETLRQLATLVEESMTEEGIPEWIRLRVVRRALFGSPDPDEAVQRVRRQNQLIELAMQAPPLNLADAAEWINHS